MKIGELYVQLDAKISGFTKKLSDAERSLQNIGKKFAAVGKQLTMKLSLPLIALGTLSVKAFGDFDRAMTESTAIMGKLSKSVKKDMADLAKTISTQTTFSAKELAAAYFYLASAGMDAQQSMGVLGDVARFAQAGTFDLSTATDLLTDAQTALGLSSKDAAVNQENLIKVSDVLVKANTLANASVQQFAEALTSKAAASLVNVNKEMEEGVAVLAAYADKGIKGRLAGERLTMMLNGLFAATQQNKKAWDDVGISLFDANGAMRGMGDIIGDLEVLLGNMTTEQKQATLAQLGFNVRTKDSILALMGSSEKIKQWTEDLKKAGGITREVSDKQMESFSNKMTVIKNKLVKVAIEMGEKLIPTVEKLAKEIEKAAKWFTNLSDGTKELIIKVLGLFAALGPVLMILGKILIVVPKLGMAFKFLATSPMGLVITGLALITAKAIEAKKEFEKSMKLYQREMEITGKKTGWFAKTWSSVSTAIEKTTTRLDINRIAQLEYNEQMRKAEGVISIVTGVTKVLSEGVGFLSEKIGGLLGNLPKTREEFSLMLTGFKNLSTETYDNLNPALRALWDSLGEKGGKGVNAAIEYTVTLAETAAKSIGSLTNSMENFKFVTVDTQKVLDNLKPVMTKVWEEAIPPARDFSNVLDQVPTKFEGIKTASEETGEAVKSKWLEVTDRIRDMWTENLGDMLSGAKSFKEGLSAIWKSMKEMFFDMVAQMATKWMFDFVRDALIKSTKKAAETIADTASGLIKGATEMSKSAAAAVSGIWTGVGAAVGTFLGTLLGGGGMSGSTEKHIHEIVDNTKRIWDVLFIDFKVEIHIMQNLLRGIFDKLEKLLPKFDIANKHLDRIKAHTEPLSKIKFAASGVSETVSSPTMYMAGEKGAERVNITPVGQGGFQQNLSIESTPVNIYLDSQKVGSGLLEHLADFSKEGRMKIHASAVKDW